MSLLQIVKAMQSFVDTFTHPLLGARDPRGLQRVLHELAGLAGRGGEGRHVDHLHPGRGVQSGHHLGLRLLNIITPLQWIVI